MLSKTLQQKFLLLNQEKVVKFKAHIFDKIDEFLFSVSKTNATRENYSSIQTQLEEDFFKELERTNTIIFEKVTENYLQQLTQLQN